MGNCLAHEFIKKPNSRAQRAVVPLNHATEPPLPQLAAPAGPKPKLSVRAVDDGGGRRMREPAAVRVKVVLTKKEAARLLSTLASTGNGSALERMLCELERTSRGSSRSPSRLGNDCWRPALESIQED